MEKQELDKLRTAVFGLYPFVDIQYHQGFESDHFIELRSIDSLTDEEYAAFYDFLYPDDGYSKGCRLCA